VGGRHPAWCGDRTALPSDTRFVYVLEGKVVLELDGKTPQTFTAGQAFVEMPGERHNFRNASTTEPAKALGFQYSDKNQPLQTNAP